MQSRVMNTGALSTRSLNLAQLNEQVYEVLKEAIIKGNLTPGQRLSINALAEQLGVSVTPVRDALRRLSADGLVEILPRRGTFVSEFNRRNIQEIFQSRRIIECASAERLADMPDDVIQQMEKIVDEISSLKEDERFRDYGCYIAMDAEFHRCVVGLLQNQQISEFYEQLRWPTQVIRGLSYSDYQRAQDTLAEHAAIVEAFKQRDVSKAKTAIRNHLNNAEADLLRRMPPEN